MKTLQNRLIELSEERNLTQQQIAIAINVSQKAVSLWLNGKNQPIADKLILLADFFQVSIDYLVGREDDTGLINNNPQLTIQEQSILEIFSKLNTAKQNMLIGYATRLLAE